MADRGLDVKPDTAVAMSGDTDGERRHARGAGGGPGSPVSDRVSGRDGAVLRADAEYAYLNGATIFGDRIIMTAIETPLNGMSVRTAADPVEELTEDMSNRQLAVENDGR